MLYASPAITAYILIVVGVLGLVMGSFLGCLAWRIVHDESIFSGRSHCDECGHALGAGDLIPVLSWLVHSGACRYCGAKILAKHPVGELICAVAYVTIVARYGITLEALQMLVFASVLFVISFTDIDDFYVPTAAVIVAVATRVVFITAAYALLAGGVDASFVFAQPAQHPAAPADAALALARDSAIGGAAIGAGVIVVVLVMDRVLARESMGGGDIKLFAVAGLYFGWQQSLFLIIVSCLIGLLFACVNMLRNQREDIDDERLAERIKDETGFDAALQRTRMPAFPFGPSIALACWVTMLVGAQAVSWYLGIFM